MRNSFQLQQSLSHHYLGSSQVYYAREIMSDLRLLQTCTALTCHCLNCLIWNSSDGSIITYLSQQIKGQLLQHRQSRSVTLPCTLTSVSYYRSVVQFLSHLVNAREVRVLCEDSIHTCELQWGKVVSLTLLFCMYTTIQKLTSTGW